MTNKKQKVIDFLKNLPVDVYECYNEAFALYRIHESKELTAERTYNQGFSETNLKNLLYDLQKVYQITDVELLHQEEPTKQTKRSLEDIVTEETKLALEYINVTSVNTELTSNVLQEAKVNFLINQITVKSLVAANPELANDETKKVIDFNVDQNTSDEDDDEKKSQKPQEESQKQLQGAAEDSQEAKEFIAAPTAEERTKLRDDFPFLKEEDCPIELKALITDKINAYQEYVSSHNQLLKHANGELELTEEQIQDLTKKATEAFELNREIYEELNYYKAQGKVLGNHPIFAALTLQREVNDMNMEAMLSFRDSSGKFFSTKKKELKDNKDNADKVAKINSAIEARTKKLELVNKKLGVAK